MRSYNLLSTMKCGVLLLILLIIGGCAINPVTGKKELMILSEEGEKALGLQSDPGIIASYGLYEDEQMQQFINEKGKQMGAISHRPELDYQFRILDSPVVNAFAVPGGFIYFTRGIMAHFNNEAEFAGVLGHEIGHVTARHSASQYSKQVFAQVGLIAGVALSKDFREYAGVAQQGIGLLFLKFGRDDETQSDGLGVEYSTKIGYDAHEMADFFNTLKRMRDQSGQSLPNFLSTHPDPGNRYNNVHALATKIQSNPNVNKSQLKVNRESYLQMIDGLVYGEDPRQGYVENNTFYHPVMKFQFPIPAGWKTQNSPQQFQMAPDDGKALMQLIIGQGNTLSEAANNYVTNNKLQMVSQRNTTINGYNTLVFLSETAPQQNQQGQQTTQQTQQTIRVLSYAIQFGDLILQFNGLSRQADFPNYENTFLGTMNNFRALNDLSKINVQPERIRIKTVDQTNTLSATLARFRMPSERYEELALLNGMELTDTVPKGSLIKVIGN